MIPRIWELSFESMNLKEGGGLGFGMESVLGRLPVLKIGDLDGE